jgi:hypothetical protein
LFSMHSHYVLMRFLKFPRRFPIAPLRYIPYGFPKSSTLMHIKVKRWVIEEDILFLFCNWGIKRCFYWGTAQCAQKLDDGQINMAPPTNTTICRKPEKIIYICLFCMAICSICVVWILMLCLFPGD